MLKNRNFQMLVLIALVLIALVSTVSAANPPVHSKRDLSWPPRPQIQQLKENIIAPPTYRDRMDECFDVPIQELTECHNTSQTFTGSSGVVEGSSDYFVRHPELRSLNAAVDTSAYFLRQKE